MSIMRLSVITLSVAAILSVSGALAGEVKGPPGTLDNTNYTGAPAHANSACAFSGLNDYDSSDDEGQSASQVQTAADSFKYYGLAHGFPGTACRGGGKK